MKVYVDTNFLVRMYLELPGCVEAVKLLRSRSVRNRWPCPATRLLRFEVINALHRMVFESRTGGQWRVTPESAAIALSDFEQDLSDAYFVVPSPLTLEDIAPEYDTLVGKYTAAMGFRTYDAIHVASAQTLGCETFLSFDKKAKSLAKLAGLKTS